LEGVEFDMDFAKLSQNEKLATYGAIAVVVGGLVGYSYGLTILAVLAAVAMLVIVFLPQMSAGTKLPGSKGSLMLIAGGVAGVVLVLALLLYIGTIFTAFNFRDLFFLVAVAGGVVMAWAGWQEFQSEGGKFQVGTTTTAAGSTPAATTPAATTDTPAARPVDSSVETVPPAEEPRPVDTSAPADAPRSDDSFGSSDREDRPNP